MSSISEESETGDDELLDEEFIVCNDNNNKNNNNNHHYSEEKSQLTTSLSVDNCLGDLNSFKQEIREAYEELSTLEHQARNKTSSTNFNKEQEDDLDILLEQLHILEQRLDQTKMFHSETTQKKKTISANIVAQFDELDQALATLTNTLNNVEIELIDSGNSSSSSAVSESNTSSQRQLTDDIDSKHQEIDGEEHFSDSGLSQSTDSISYPFKNQSQLRTHSQLSNASSVLSCDTLKNESHIRLALEKMHEANIKKMFIKIHNEDQSTKNLLIDEKMSISGLIILLLHKYHLKPTYNYSIVEELPDLHLYRLFEDHENLIHNALNYWSRDTTNRICFQQHSIKYSMFTEPKKFFSIKDKHSDNILTDYISSNSILLPDDITSTLFLKDKTRKIWKKYTCILRQSGIYQLPKTSSTKRDLVCLIKFEPNMHLYYGKNWIESLHSPTDYGFALKYVHIQKKSNKYIHYLCTNTFDDYQRWINGIRIIQYGRKLYENFEQMKAIVDHGLDYLGKILPNQHHFNFIQSTRMCESMSTISLPINQIFSDEKKSPFEQNSMDKKKNFNSLDRLKISKTNFTRSSSFHDSLRRSNKTVRTSSTSPTKNTDINLKRSKSNKELQSKSSTKLSATSSIIPLINQCIHPERTTANNAKSTVSPPRRPPPPIPKKQSILVDNHIYDSFQDSPILPNKQRRSYSQAKILNDNCRSVSKTDNLRPMKVTEL